MMASSKKRGFTIVEMLIVVAIIGILSAITTSNLSNSRAKARDAKRVSDMAQIQMALNQYYARCSVYPQDSSHLIPSEDGLYDRRSEGDCEAQPTGVTLSNFIATVPKDPNGSRYDYSVFDSMSDQFYDYEIHAHLELPNSVVLGGLPASKTPDFTDQGGRAQKWSGTPFSCDNIASSLDYCIGPK